MIRMRLWWEASAGEQLGVHEDTIMWLVYPTKAGQEKKKKTPSKRLLRESGGRQTEELEEPAHVWRKVCDALSGKEAAGGLLLKRGRAVLLRVFIAARHAGVKLARGHTMPQDPRWSCIQHNTIFPIFCNRLSASGIQMSSFKDSFGTIKLSLCLPRV